MRPHPTAMAAIVLAITFCLELTGCILAPPPPPGVVLVGEDGYRHEGYYDDHHRWHGGYRDEHGFHHDDREDWHERR